MNNIILWILDGTVVAQRTNLSAFTSGNIMIGYMDPFASIANPAEDAFVLFDKPARGRPQRRSASTARHHLPAVKPKCEHRRQRQLHRSVRPARIPLATNGDLTGQTLPARNQSLLSLTNVQTASTGAYDVLVVSNTAGLAASAPATLLP